MWKKGPFELELKWYWTDYNTNNNDNKSNNFNSNAINNNSDNIDCSINNNSKNIIKRERIDPSDDHSQHEGGIKVHQHEGGTEVLDKDDHHLEYEDRKLNDVGEHEWQSEIEDEYRECGESEVIDTDIIDIWIIEYIEWWE